MQVKYEETENNITNLESLLKPVLRDSTFDSKN